MPEAFESTLNIDNLGDLDDGTVRHVVNAALQEALDDCDARAMLEKDRKVGITIAFRPLIDTSSGAMKGVATDVEVKTKVPARKGNGDYLRTNVRGDHVSAYLPDSHQDDMFTRREPSDGEAS